MILDYLNVTEKRPTAFKDVAEIVYLQVRFLSFEFVSWGSLKLDLNFQIPRGVEKDLSSLLYFIFTNKIPCTDKIEVSVSDEFLKVGWTVCEGTYKINESDDFYIWNKGKYKKQLKQIKNNKNTKKNRKV